jgi:hypothetical protein
MASKPKLKKRSGKEPVRSGSDHAKKSILDEFRDQDWKAVVLYVEGYKLDDIEVFTEVKRETFREKLMKVFRNNLWDDMETIAVRKYEGEVERGQFADLFNECFEENRGQPAFRRAGELRARKWLQKSQEETQDLLFRATLLKPSKSS